MGKEVNAVFKYIDCIDAGSDYCPCSLAEKGECIICSQLKGMFFCDCLNWKGTCIYHDYINNDNKAKKARRFEMYDILKKEYIRHDLFTLDIKVNKTLSRELNNIGSFVFLKNPCDSDSYSTPISVLESNIFTNIIKVAIKTTGVKTKSLEKSEKRIYLKGPYWNGIQGLKYINELKNKNILILGRGVAAAPAVLASKKLIYNGNQVYVLLDPGRSEENFTKPYFKKHGCIVKDISFCSNDMLRDEFKIELERLIKKWNFKAVLSAGDDKFHSMIINYINDIDSYINFSTVNNSVMCCGEGICGSCRVKSSSGENIKSCKQQFNPKEIFLRGSSL